MNSVTAIIDARTPQKAIETLQTYAEVFLFRSQDITYGAISCHPDIFLFQGSEHLIIAPNTPHDCLSFISSRNIPFVFGTSIIGKELTNSTNYNCIETEKHFFHKQGFTDNLILKSISKPFIALPQAYTRCSMIAISESAFITSDRGIEKVLKHQGFDVLYINPSCIVLPPYKNGFIGGCMGLWNNTLFIIGSLQTIENTEEVKEFILQRNIGIVELYDGPLFDGGGIFFCTKEIRPFSVS